MPAILFDLDGTLVDSLSDIAGIVNHTRGAHGLSPIPIDTIRGFIGRGLEHLIAGTFPEIEPEKLRELGADYHRYYLEHPYSTGALYPGVRETLYVLRQRPGLKLGVVTNKPSLVADKTLAHYLPGLHFDIVAGPERVSHRKPDPRHLLDALVRIETRPADALYLGDDPVDAQCAEAAGVRFLGAGYGFGGVEVGEEQMLRAFPDLLNDAFFA